MNVIFFICAYLLFSIVCYSVSTTCIKRDPFMEYKIQRMQNIFKKQEPEARRKEEDRLAEIRGTGEYLITTGKSSMFLILFFCVPVINLYFTLMILFLFLINNETIDRIEEKHKK